MFDDDDDLSRFSSKPRGASRRVTSHVSHANLGLETSAGPMRLYITTTVVVEIEDESCPLDNCSGEPAARPTRRLPMRSKR
jgi:hypothetical protein